MKKIKLSVSIILFCGDEIYFVKRKNNLRAFPGYCVFPGGKVDNEDISETKALTLLKTLKRELKEELNLVINEHKVELLAKATSPDFNPVRFETYFFKVFLNKKETFTLCQNEIDSGFWLKPAEYLAAFNRGEFLSVRPVKLIVDHMAQGLDHFINFDEIMAKPIIPTIENIKGLIQVMPRSNTLLPATRTNAFIIGDKEKVLVDPSPKDENELKKLLLVLKDYHLDKIFITHHHGDHHQFSPVIARELKLPIFISKDSFDRIMAKWGIDYFDDVMTHLSHDGDSVCTWLGEDVKVYEIPGHDEGHLGLAPSSLKWFLVGDLFQGVGSVVVGGHEGDMGKYFTSLQRVIDLKPGCVVPSHGIPLGGSYILEKTLIHRKMREEQIIKLLDSQKNNNEILDIVYAGLPEKLLPYAMKNIEAHIAKIEKDQAILK